jgi:hypothetical protein
MGLQNETFYGGPGYYNITGFEYNAAKQRLRIRATLYRDKKNKEKIRDEEYTITPETFIPSTLNEARDKIKISSIESRAKEYVGYSEKTKAEKDALILDIYSNEVALIQKDLAKKAIRKFYKKFISFDCIEACYDGLKMLPHFKSAIDD